MGIIERIASWFAQECEQEDELVVDLLLEAHSELKRLRDLKRSCECSEEDQCAFARERDEAREAARWLYHHHVLQDDGIVDHGLSGYYETDRWPWLLESDTSYRLREESECHTCGSISGVYLQMCDDCVTRFNQQAAEINHLNTQLREQCEMYNVDVGMRDEKNDRLCEELSKLYHVHQVCYDERLYDELGR